MKQVKALKHKQNMLRTKDFGKLINQLMILIIILILMK